VPAAAWFGVLVLAAGCLGPSPRARPSAPSAALPAGAAFRAPLPGAEVISPFGPRGRRFHSGIDLRVSRRGGEPVLAAAAGRVADIRSGGGYGNMVLLKHKDGTYTRYAHLREFRVKRDQRVERGQVLGFVGRTGRATTPHLHFEILTETFRAVDPAPLIRP
jgi:murein DD-endopeptidase MepM/ murein hydrolase activator NlpD